jgi:3-oxoacyl-[acyl-carrier protein] reductase
MRLDDLAGKRGLVTGAGTGIGAAVAKALAQQGVAVAVHYNTSEAAAMKLLAEIRDSGGKAVALQGDIAKRGGARKLVEEAAASLGGLDILINNAGSLVSRTPFEQAGDDLIDAVVDLNLRSVIEACQAAIAHLERRPGGVIINVGSIAAIDGGGPGSGLYASAKAFVHNLTRHLARDLAAKGIRVNTVSPGVINTRFHAATPPERMEAMRRSVHLGRIGEPEDCAGAFLFLASSQMSGYITGQNIHVNGGQYMP